ncbi:MAG: hypothetical protein BRC29_03400 [Nanohaloarchaea archaeon SW_7_43_1]|nr:MAG: hypothetical protein BRC29_03400 [Nanohaloarchaea archaeon SW_7_43_1]
MARNHPILTDKETKEEIRKRVNILEARRGEEVSEDEVVKRALKKDKFLEEKEHLLEGLFD